MSKRMPVNMTIRGLCFEIDRLKAENAELRAGLKFYADGGHCGETEGGDGGVYDAILDYGEKAKEILSKHGGRDE